MIDLYTSPTPNGRKISIMLEEIGLDYTVHNINLGQQEQKRPEFLAMNPNGRIPLYLAEKTGQLLPQEEKARSRVIQWLMFQMGNLGPMMGQANVFVNYFDEKIPAVIDRYQHEGRRLLTVLDQRLEGREYTSTAWTTWMPGSTGWKTARPSRGEKTSRDPAPAARSKKPGRASSSANHPPVENQRQEM